MCTANVIGRAFPVLLIDDAHGAASWSIVCRGLITDTPGSNLNCHWHICTACNPTPKGALAYILPPPMYLRIQKGIGRCTS